MNEELKIMVRVIVMAVVVECLSVLAYINMFACYGYENSLFCLMK